MIRRQTTAAVIDGVVAHGGTPAGPTECGDILNKRQEKHAPRCKLAARRRNITFSHLSFLNRAFYLFAQPRNKWLTFRRAGVSDGTKLRPSLPVPWRRERC